MRIRKLGGVISSVLLILGTVSTSRAGPPPEKAISVLLVTGGHGYEEAAFDDMFRSFDGVRVVHQSHPRALETITSAAGDGFDVIALYDMTQKITEEQKTAYATRIRGGTGFVVLHHALADYQAWPEFERMVGGKYHLRRQQRGGVARGPSGYRHGRDIPVQIADHEHWITRGMEDFTIHDETYRDFSVDPAARVLLRTEEATSGPVLAWTKPYGKARVVYLQLGHDGKAYGNPSYRRLVSRSIRWAARRTPEDRGWTSLFDGESLEGWKSAGKARFSVEDGVLLGRQGPGEAAGDLYTEAEYDDFELAVTWKMAWPGNSGIWFRHVDGRHAYQADILEYKSPVCWSGSLYCAGKMFIAKNEDPSLVRREGWNEFRVVARGDHITVDLNGRRVADVRDDSSSRGRIGIQVHPGSQFANMAIRIAEARIRPLR